jgi:hypothetical protein
MSKCVTSSPSSSYRDFFAKLYGPIEEDKNKQNVKKNFGLDDFKNHDVNKNVNFDDKNNVKVDNNKKRQHELNEEENRPADKKGENNFIGSNNSDVSTINDNSITKDRRDISITKDRKDNSITKDRKDNSITKDRKDNSVMKKLKTDDTPWENTMSQCKPIIVHNRTSGISKSDLLIRFNWNSIKMFFFKQYAIQNKVTFS